MLVQFGTNNTELTGGIGATGTQVHLTGDKVKVDPAAILSRQDALCAKNHAIGAQIQFFQRIMHKVHGKLLVGLSAPGSKDLVGMMMVMVMIMALAAASAVLVVGLVMVVLVIMMFMVVIVVMVMIVIMMIMIVVVAAAIAMLVMIVVMMMLVIMVVMVVLMIVIMAAAGAVLVMIVVMMRMVVLVVMMVLYCLHLCNDLCDGGAAFHSFLQLLTGQLAPGSGDDGGIGVVFLQHCYSGVQFLLGHRVSAGKNDAGSGFHLVVIELTEVLHVDLYLVGIHDRHGTAKLYILTGDLLHSADHIGQLANTGGLNDDTVGVVFVDDLRQRTAKVTHQAAADAAGVHLGNVDACLLQEAAVNADLTKLIFDENQLFALIAFGDHLLDQGGFAGTQEAGIDVNSGHILHLSLQLEIHLLIFTQYSQIIRIFYLTISIAR